MGLRDFLMKKMIAQKMKDVPQEEQEKLFKMVQENPDFFRTIGDEIQEKMKGGKDQMTATMEVMQSHQDELQKIMKK